VTPGQVEANKEKANVVFVLGGPGSGKGTQCARLVADFGFIHLSTGDLLRKEVENKGPQAEKIEEVLKEGRLVSSEMLVELIKGAFEKHGMQGKFLLDGFPRSQQNVEAWDQIIKDSVNVPCLLYFSCSEETMKNRLLKRAETSGRSDDNEETIMKRFHTFQSETEPILQQFRDKNKVQEISAEGDVDEVYTNVKQAIQAHFP
jgi:UMP-CMP kinase family protein